MSDYRALPWGEKHLYNNYFTVKVKIGTDLRHVIGDKLDAIKQLSLWSAGIDKKGKEYFMITGVLTYKEFTQYRLIKEEAQLQLLVNAVREKVSRVKIIKNEQALIDSTFKTAGPPVEC